MDEEDAPPTGELRQKRRKAVQIGECARRDRYAGEAVKDAPSGEGANPST